MDNTVPEGTRRIIDGRERVFYSGYWVKTYAVPEDTLQAKRKLIGALTRRSSTMSSTASTSLAAASTKPARATRTKPTPTAAA
jgi:hypothetical protein